MERPLQSVTQALSVYAPGRIVVTYKEGGDKYPLFLNLI